MRLSETAMIMNAKIQPMSPKTDGFRITNVIAAAATQSGIAPLANSL
jgi:hypothetical protein